MTRLLLVRHGQSTWNAEGRWQGQADPPLTETGRRQAWEACAALGAVDAVCSSTLERARNTAEIISEELGVGPVVSHPGLVERHAGEWQGLTRAEIEERWPGHLDRGDRPAGWEPDDALCARALDALAAIAGGVGHGEAVVVTHGGVIYALEAMLGSGFERLANLGARWIERRGDDWLLGDRVDLLGGVDVTVPDQI